MYVCVCVRIVILVDFHLIFVTKIADVHILH